MNGVDLSSRVLLAEILRRAVYDWVLYRSSTRLRDVDLARNAYVWLFEEGPGHPDWLERQKHGWTAFSFLTICDSLDMDPGAVRERVKKMTPSDVTSVGRPPVRRRKPYEIVGGGLESVSINHVATAHLLDQGLGDVEEIAVEW